MDCWISPEGRIYPVYQAQHGDSHWEFAQKRLPKSHDPVAALEMLGWLHISGGNVLPPEKPITNSQTDALFQLLEEYPTFRTHLESVIYRNEELFTFSF